MFLRKPREKDDYLGQLDEFMNDNLKTIADLIAIKKGMQGDVKAARQATQDAIADCKELEKQLQGQQNKVQSEHEKRISIEFQKGELEKVLIKMKRAILEKEVKLEEDLQRILEA